MRDYNQGMITSSRTSNRQQQNHHHVPQYPQHHHPGYYSGNNSLVSATSSTASSSHQQQQQQQQQQQHRNSNLHKNHQQSSSPPLLDSSATTTSTVASTTIQQQQTAAATQQSSSTATHSRSSSPQHSQQSQQQHHHQQRAVTTRSSSPSSSYNSQNHHQLSTSDALSVRQNGVEYTINKLREALQESTSIANTKQAKLDQTDAVVVELRNKIKQQEQQLQNNNSSPTKDSGVIGELQNQLDHAHAKMITSDMVRKELEDTLEAEQYTWELRVQDQERTIENLQTTIETMQQQHETDLAAQKQQKEQQNTSTGSADGGLQQLQEQIASLQHERTELQSCLDEALKELEAVDAELQNEDSASQQPLLAELRDENERLQSELLQTTKSLSVSEQTSQATIRSLHSDTLESFQHLYRWTHDECNSSKKNNTAVKSRWEKNTFTEPNEIIRAIQQHLQSEFQQLMNQVTQQEEKTREVTANTTSTNELKAQVSSLRSDLHAKDTSATELRKSLKEAVTLLKPLQDAVAKGDREKLKLQEHLTKAQSKADTTYIDLKQYKQSLNDKEDEIDNLHQSIEDLELQLSKAKLEAANSVVAATRAAAATPDTSVTNDELRAKRTTEQHALKQLLIDAQSRFSSTVHQQNVSELQNKEDDDDTIKGLEVELRNTIQQHVLRIEELEEQVNQVQDDVTKKDDEIKELRQKRSDAGTLYSSDGDDVAEEKRVERIIQELEGELLEKNKIVESKREAERALNKSLKDALDLIKPLQMHLEESEEEKRELLAELTQMQQQTTPTKQTNLEHTIEELEEENSKLHDALEDMSQSINNASLASGSVNNGMKPAASIRTSGKKTTDSGTTTRVREELVEMQSRYEVTQGRLDEAFVENQSLVEALQQQEQQETHLRSEYTMMHQRVEQSAHDLDHAKYVAANALAKVEELTSTIEDLASDPGSGSRASSVVSYNTNGHRRMRQSTPTVRSYPRSTYNSNGTSTHKDGEMEPHEKPPSRTTTAR